MVVVVVVTDKAVATVVVQAVAVASAKSCIRGADRCGLLPFFARYLEIVPTLCVGMLHWALCVRCWGCDAERHRMRTHAERGNDL